MDDRGQPEKEEPVVNREGFESRDDRVYNNGSTQEWYQKIKHSVYYVLGVLEVLLAFRLVFKLLGASVASSFVSFIYSITNVFVAPFTGIFRTFVSKADSTQFILEPGTVIAMVVYSVIAYGIVRLVRLRLAGHAYGR